ncbi:hypothetical protein PENSPDRAFT_374187 [Peniophora sp. CONT]|nr:hypothetical protein PENSPDRAFT_374187 [Peniophora sp. CONT]
MSPSESGSSTLTFSSPASSILSIPSILETDMQDPKDTQDVQDEYFYFQSVVFKAEKTLFRVPRYGLPADVAAFDAMFSQASPGGAGSSNENPIFLDSDVKAFDFRSLLKASYPPPGTTASVLTLDEWMGVLTLANKWNLVNMKEKAIAGSNVEVQNKSTVDKVLLAKKYNVARWLKEGYYTLVSRKDPITPDERTKLGWETYARLLDVREKGRDAALDTISIHLSSSNAKAAKQKCAMCGVDHVAYCAQNAKGKEKDKKYECAQCDKVYHVPGCWAGKVDSSADAKGRVQAHWAAFNYTAAVEKEFGAAVKG